MTQIRECGRTIGGGIVVFDISWDGDLPAGKVAWVVTISGDGDEQVALVHERTDGAFAAQYLQAGAGRHDVEEDATVEDDHLTARFPADLVGVATQWPVWKAAVVVNGQPASEQVIPTT